MIIQVGDLLLHNCVTSVPQNVNKQWEMPPLVALTRVNIHLIKLGFTQLDNSNKIIDKNFLCLRKLDELINLS